MKLRAVYQQQWSITNSAFGRELKAGEEALGEDRRFCCVISVIAGVFRALCGGFRGRLFNRGKESEISASASLSGDLAVGAGNCDYG